MNVLLIQLKRIGDLVLTVPAIAALRKSFPAAKISLIVAHGSRELLPAIPGVDHTFVARGRVTDAPQWFALATSTFDYCLDFSRTDRSAFLTALSGARNRITYDTIRREPLRQLSYNEFVPSQVRFAHTVDHHLALLAPLGVHDASPEIRLALPPEAKARAAAIMNAHHLAGDFVILHPGSARAEKFWLARRWAEVANRITAHEQMPVVLTGGKARMEQEHIARIKKHLDQPVVDLSGHLDLLSLAVLLQQARLLLTIDSAPMHLAAALGTPQVALFGPTNPFHWRPRSTPAIVLNAGNDHPATDFVPIQPPVAMKEISTKQVIDAMQTLLSIPAAPVA
ncbi:MAG TPA: putative lipopolysaccharide heptosyltransferase III [Chthoniobacterales bacterium]|nr:putative lipopolysaccharide heptosyltransferase III [Chthoniobacterales bacterium]